MKSSISIRLLKSAKASCGQKPLLLDAFMVTYMKFVNYLSSAPPLANDIIVIIMCAQYSHKVLKVILRKKYQKCQHSINI